MLPLSASVGLKLSQKCMQEPHNLHDVLACIQKSVQEPHNLHGVIACIQSM